MPFELPDVIEVTCNHANPRTEFHGEERVRAIDLAFTVTGENTLLDAIAPGLRQHHYCNRAADAKQEALPDVAVPLPNLRFPQLPTTVKVDQPKARGYRWVWDWGRDAQHVDFTDAALGNVSYELKEGGTVDVKFTVSYNGDELSDNALYGELCGIASMGKVHIQLLAPPELVPVKKGWRSGKADEPEKTDKGAPLLEGAKGPGDDDHDEDDTGDAPPEGTPEAALAGAVAADSEAAEKHAAAWPFPNSAHEEREEREEQQQYPTPPAKRGRGNRRAAA